MSNQFKTIKDVYAALLAGETLVARNGNILYFDKLTGDFNIPNPQITAPDWWTIKEREVTITLTLFNAAVAAAVSEIKGPTNSTDLANSIARKLGLVS